MLTGRDDARAKPLRLLLQRNDHWGKLDPFRTSADDNVATEGSLAVKRHEGHSPDHEILANNLHEGPGTGGLGQLIVVGPGRLLGNLRRPEAHPEQKAKRPRPLIIMS